MSMDWQVSRIKTKMERDTAIDLRILFLLDLVLVDLAILTQCGGDQKKIQKSSNSIERLHRFLTPMEKSL